MILRILFKASLIVVLLFTGPFSLFAENSDKKFASVVDALKQDDLKKGFDLLQSMAKQGDSYAQFLIGSMYAEGLFFKKDAGKGESWLLKSAKQGNIFGQFFLGEKLDKRDDSEAIKWYLKSAAQGLAESQKRLGDIYFKGKIVLEDYAEALNWYLKAAENGNKKAKIQLGQMHQDGIGANQDRIKAHMWFNLSGSYHKREKLEKYMQNRDVLKAQQMARKWLKDHPKGKNNSEKEMVRSKLPSLFPELLSALSQLDKAEKKKQHKPKSDSEKTSNLLKELDELEQLNKQAHTALGKSKVKQNPSKVTGLLKQLESIKKKNGQIKIDTSKLSSGHSQKFKTEIRDLELAEIQSRVTAPTASEELEDPGMDALSKYVGEVYVKIYKNWEDPLGGGNGVVQVSFSIFPMGNIAMPKVLKSSGDSKLDNLAIRAIKNAVPLPPFPKEINEPNLPLILKFNYVPKK